MRYRQIPCEGRAVAVAAALSVFGTVTALTATQGVVASLALAIPALAPDAVYASEINPEALDRLPAADVVLLGEVHDNPIHHRNQARALTSLGPAAVVFEMLSPEQADRVNAVSERGPALGEALQWQESGWPDYALYQPVFQALGSARVYGMAVPRARIRAVFESAVTEVFGEDAARYGLDRPLAPEIQDAREAHQMAVHCDALPEDLLAGMVAAQRLRDAEFARTTLQALEDTGGPVAVITGTGHVRRDWGMPVALAQVAPDVSVLALGQLELTAPADPPYDLWLITPAAEREDPCLAFRTPG